MVITIKKSDIRRYMLLIIRDEEDGSMLHIFIQRQHNESCQIPFEKGQKRTGE
jgi:hypothetical protein